MVISFHLCIDAPLIRQVLLWDGFPILCIAHSWPSWTDSPRACNQRLCRFCLGWLRQSHFDGLEDVEVHHLLPLCEDKVVLFEIFSEELGRCLAMLHYDFTVLIQDRRGKQVPPPATLLEDLKQELRVVATPDESSIVLKQGSLEMELNIIALVNSLKEASEHLLL